jgi:hypothetical protein
VSERLGQGNPRYELRVARCALRVARYVFRVGWRPRLGPLQATDIRAETQNAQRATRNAQLALVVIPALLLAAPAASIAISRHFDGLYGQDAYAYFDYATQSVRHSILNLAPLETFFWPPGYPILVALASLAIGPLPVAGQLVSLAMGALVPVLTALIVRELLPDDLATALLAGAIAALSGQLWQSSIVVMADTTGLALATFSAFALLRYRRSNKVGWLIAASAALAYATLARWIYGLVAIPFATYGLSALPHLRNTAVRHAIWAVAIAAALLLPVLGPPLLGLLSHPDAPASFAGNLQVYSWSPLNAFQRDFLTADGHLSYPWPNGVYYAVAPLNPAFFGLLLAPWALVGGWVAFKSWPPSRLGLIVGWIGIVYAFHAGAPWQNFRFTLAYLPPLAILCALGLVWTWRMANSRIAVIALVCAVLGLLSTAYGGVRLVQGFIDRKQEDLALVHWVDAQVEPGARLFTFGPTLTFRHYTQMLTFDLFDVTASDISSVLAIAAPTYLVVDEHNLQDQWLDKAPDQNFQKLRDGPGLTPLGSQGVYTLFRVGST